jgi:hypothetical protein
MSDRYYLAPLCEVLTSLELYHPSPDIMERWPFSFYDSLIVQQFSVKAHRGAGWSHVKSGDCLSRLVSLEPDRMHPFVMAFDQSLLNGLILNAWPCPVLGSLACEFHTMKHAIIRRLITIPKFTENCCSSLQQLYRRSVRSYTLKICSIIKRVNP